MSLLLAALGTLGAILVVLGIALGSLLWRVLGKVLGNELEAAVPELAQGLLEKAVERIPAEHRPRLEEEWTAGLKGSLQKRPLWALLQAVSLYQKAGHIAAELEPAPVSVHGNESGGEGSQSSSRFSGIASRMLRPWRLWRTFKEIGRVASELESTYRALVYDEATTAPGWMQRLVKSFMAATGLSMIVFVLWVAYAGLHLLGII